MFSRLPKPPHTTAAWRLSIWTTLAFATGAALAFGIVYLLVAKAIRKRSDTWLRGEVEVLAEVSASTPRDRLYNRIVEEVAELASEEVAAGQNSKGKRLNSVFFLQTDPAGQAALWVGPEAKHAFLVALRASQVVPDVPQSINVRGWAAPFRVVVRQRDHGGKVYLGLSDGSALRLLLRLTYRFLWIWAGMVLFGFLISYMSARRTLRRVEGITETVAHIGTDDLRSRVPEGPNSDEISRLARTFNHMLDRIQASVHQLRAVTDAVAHDLKSPVTSIRGRLEVALSDGENGRWREEVAQSIEDLDKMGQLLNTTLDLAEAEAGALPLERKPVNLTGVVSRLVELYQPAITDRQHELSVELEPDIVIDGDMALMNRVMGNLLDNEVAHLPPGCRIRILLSSQENRAQLVIEDNGPGFAPEIMSHSFERFVKGKHSSGHGLGLAFVDAIAQAHGGTAMIDCRPGGGARIRLSLPVAAQDTA
ncbi:MAG TPA: HAMP domain-containing sensor histidine kinase [Terriglobia bacterium]|nr:HAMP domain-containing sensor histidine kinase [Terriglobia bacterium]